jgi:hypothetical protein
VKILHCTMVVGLVVKMLVEAHGGLTQPPPGVSSIYDNVPWECFRCSADLRAVGYICR